MVRAGRNKRAIVLALLAASAASFGSRTAAHAQDPAPAAWRVECTGDGKVLECRAIQQMFNRDDKQLVVQLTARTQPPSKIPTMTLQLPLGLNVAEPVQLKVDSGPVEKQPVQTCTATGCFVTMQIGEKLLEAMRTGTLLKVIMQGQNKRTVAVDVPLLGFGLALDKANK